MEIFKPRFSGIGWIISTGMFVFSLWLCWKVLLINRGGSIVSVSSFLVAVFVLAALFFLIIYPTMRYEFRKETLWLKCGPFRWKIPYSEIKEIIKTNLKYHPTSTGWKLPGYTVGKVYYTDRGNVRMCATGMCRNIILIKTDKALFGVTPKDEERFIQVLKARTK